MAEAEVEPEKLRAGITRLSRTVIALGFVSLLTDMSSEMAYTQVPIYLTGVLGVGAVSVGLIEGVAESTASLMRLVSGYWSDKTGKRKPLTVLGYSFGAISKPLMALAYAWPLVLLLRFVDRFGKGLRTAPRDALIAETTPKELRGRAFGLHRTMDTTGAVLGPLLGLAFLGCLHRYAHSYDLGHNLRLLFLFAGLPGLFAVLTLLFAVKEEKEKRRKGEEEKAQSSISKPESKLRLPIWKDLQPAYKRFLLVILLFNLGNSSDAFLVLRATRVWALRRHRFCGCTRRSMWWKRFWAMARASCLTGWGGVRSSLPATACSRSCISVSDWRVVKPQSWFSFCCMASTTP